MRLEKVPSGGIQKLVYGGGGGGGAKVESGGIPLHDIFDFKILPDHFVESQGGASGFQGGPMPPPKCNP